MLRRKRLPPDLAPVHSAFRIATERVERAKEAIVEAVPTGRGPGRPLAEALAEFEEHLRDAAARMDAWRAPAVEELWSRCRRGLADAESVAERLRSDPPPLRFESVLATVEELLAPLEPFHAAAEAFLDLRA